MNTQSSSDPNVRYSDDDIIDEFVTYFVGGMDTTGHLIGMTLYNLHHHPQYKTELKQERDLIYNNLAASTDILHKMDVLHSHLKETMRICNPSPMIHIREALEDHEILDLKIKKGDYLGCDFFSLFFDERHFSNPEEYNPARWRDVSVKQDPYAFTPFSGGPRN